MIKKRAVWSNKRPPLGISDNYKCANIARVLAGCGWFARYKSDTHRQLRSVWTDCFLPLPVPNLSFFCYFLWCEIYSIWWWNKENVSIRHLSNRFNVRLDILYDFFRTFSIVFWKRLITYFFVDDFNWSRIRRHTLIMTAQTEQSEWKRMKQMKCNFETTKPLQIHGESK